VRSSPDSDRAGLHGRPGDHQPSRTADQRGETISSYFVVPYVAIAAPVIGVGFAVESLGLYDAALAFAIAIGALTLVAEAMAFLGPTRACLGRGLPCSDGWLAAHNLWRGC
jgi:hypothetical protein